MPIPVFTQRVPKVSLIPFSILPSATSSSAYIFWKRFGTRTQDAGSGTEHEFLTAYEAWKKNGTPQIMVYFNQTAFLPELDEIEQFKQVREFQKRFPKEGLWRPYAGVDKFKDFVRRHLGNFLWDKFSLGHKVDPTPSPPAAGAVVLGQTPADLAIQDHTRLTLAELSPSLEPYYVSLEATAEFLEKAPSGLMLPPSFEPLVRYRHGLTQRSERLETAELATDCFCQFVVLGEPGAGKTTFLRSLEWKACTRLLSNPVAPVPLFIRLTQWPEGKSDLRTLILYELEVRALRDVPTRRLMLLLDELNEIDAASYGAKLKAINNWVRANPSVPIVVASRRQHYEAAEKLPLPNLLLHALDDSRVETFIRNYLGDQADGLLSELIWEPRGPVAERRLSHLARNPYLLRLLCYVYEPTGKAPPLNRGQLFKHLVEIRWKRESEIGNTADLDCASLVLACSELAIAMICSGASSSVHRDFALKHLSEVTTPKRVLKLMEDASLIHTAKMGASFNLPTRCCWNTSGRSICEPIWQESTRCSHDPYSRTASESAVRWMRSC